jgi:hypothetical protein
VLAGFTSAVMRVFGPSSPGGAGGRFGGCCVSPNAVTIAIDYLAV